MSEKKNLRLGSIALLPREADDDIAWAETTFKDGRRTQSDIYAEFAERLRSKSIVPPSGKAFNRWTMTLRGRNASGANNVTDHFPIRDETRRLLAAGLRALADDLDGGRPKPGMLSQEAYDEITHRILGTEL